MLKDKTILIVEDNVFLALDLSSVVEDLNGRVVGPASSAAEALYFLESDEIVAAVVDCDLVDADIAQLVMQLADKSIPVVMHTAAGPPPEVVRALPDAPVLRDPVQPKQILVRLIDEIERIPKNSERD